MQLYNQELLCTTSQHTQNEGNQYCWLFCGLQISKVDNEQAGKQGALVSGNMSYIMGGCKLGGRVDWGWCKVQSNGLLYQGYLCFWEFVPHLSKHTLS